MASSTLTFGSRGPRVLELQNYLQTQTGADGQPLHDGLKKGGYDETTQYAVSKYQQMHGITPTGTWDAQTQQVREQLAQPTSSPFDITVTAQAEDHLESGASAGHASVPVAKRPGVVTRAMDSLGAPTLPLGIYTNPKDRAEALQQAHIQQFGVRTDPPGPPILEDSSIGSPFGMRMHPIKHVMRMHNGVDFPQGETFIAPEGGYLVVDRSPRGDEGVMVTVYGDSGKNYTAMHLSVGSIPRELQNGSRVEEGATLGLKGSTGLSTGPHFHIQVSENHEGKRVMLNPELVFAEHIRGSQMAGLQGGRGEVQLASADADISETAALNRAMAAHYKQLASAGVVHTPELMINPPQTLQSVSSVHLVPLTGVESTAPEAPANTRAEGHQPVARGGFKGI